MIQSWHQYYCFKTKINLKKVKKPRVSWTVSMFDDPIKTSPYRTQIVWPDIRLFWNTFVYLHNVFLQSFFSSESNWFHNYTSGCVCVCCDIHIATNIYAISGVYNPVWYFCKSIELISMTCIGKSHRMNLRQYGLRPLFSNEWLCTNDYWVYYTYILATFQIVCHVGKEMPKTISIYIYIYHS